jgi:4-amino-4-deoxy-L-arabinose transferase-like glycosyltransferase
MLRARNLQTLWVAAIAVLFGLHFAHLLADFPNHSPWMADYAKYTDEGWYANAAIRYHLTGHWYLPGDFNPAVALPIWPLLLVPVFHFTGVSLTAARATALVLFGLNLLLVYAVLRTQTERWTALLAVTLLVSSPFLYAFSRLALLEPLLMTFLLLSWLLALRLPRTTQRRQTLSLIAIGLLLCLSILTKTTALFVLPSTLFLIAHAFRFQRTAIRALAITAIAAAIPWSAWYFLFVRPYYRADYQYLFTSNQWPQPTTLSGWLAAFWYALHGALWISPTLCLTAVALLVLTLIPIRSAIATETRASSLTSNPILPAALLLAAGYIFFAGWHNSPQPRYYTIVLYALVILLVLSAADLLRLARHAFLRFLGAASLAIMAAVTIAGGFRIVNELRRPEYTLVNAASGIARIIDASPGPHLLLSISGDEITLITRLPAICDDYGNWDLPWRIHAYQPAWYAAWNDLDPGTLEDLQSQESLQQVAAFPAFDDPDRNLLVLYRLNSLPTKEQKFDARREALENAHK